MHHYKIWISKSYNRKCLVYKALRLIDGTDLQDLVTSLFSSIPQDVMLLWPLQAELKNIPLTLFGTIILPLNKIHVKKMYKTPLWTALTAFYFLTLRPLQV